MELKETLGKHIIASHICCMYTKVTKRLHNIKQLFLWNPVIDFQTKSNTDFIRQRSASMYSNPDLNTSMFEMGLIWFKCCVSIYKSSVFFGGFAKVGLDSLRQDN